jgi:hypothetical protein
MAGVKAGGIVGRGVLLDWLSWYEAQGNTVDPVSAHAIPVSELIEGLLGSPPFSSPTDLAASC